MWSARIEVQSIRASANGKGHTKELAVASAFAELAERLSAGMETGIDIGPFRQLYGIKGDMLSKVTTYKYMEGYTYDNQDNLTNAIKVEDFCRRLSFSDYDFKTMKKESELLRHWIYGYSLTREKVVQVPILFVKWISSTNGLASGNTIEEAIAHGCREIFERNAMIDFLRGETPSEQCPIIDQATIQNDIIKKQLEFFNYNNVDVIIRNIGNELYPVFAVLTYNSSIPKSNLGYNHIKAGCSFNSDEAIIRCFTERMQGTNINFEKSQGKMPEDITPDRHMSLFFKGICPMDLTHLMHGSTKPYVPFSEDDIAVEINSCVDIANKLNTEVIVINHTHPVIKFPTARVIMPGISDFMKWWDPAKIIPNLVGNLQPEEDAYEEKLLSVLNSFFYKGTV